MYRYKCHRNADTGLHFDNLTNKNTTWLSFDKWLTFYNADTENWEIYNHLSYWKSDNYYLPAYKKEEGSGHDDPVYQYIKFLTRKDYRKFKRFVKRMKKRGEDLENTNEILELADIIGNRATLRLEAAQEEINKQYNNMLILQERAGYSSDDISHLQLPPPLQIPEEPLVTIDLDKPEETLNNLVIVGTPNEVITLNTWRDLEKYTKADFHTGVVIYNTKENQTYIVGEDRKLRRVKG